MFGEKPVALGYQRRLWRIMLASVAGISCRLGAGGGVIGCVSINK
jgi:hypothetical protein